MKKIFICGCVGVGKTTFAKRLSEKLNIGTYELNDKILENADKVIFLDLKKFLIYERIFRRYFQGIKKRNDHGKIGSLIHLLFRAFSHNSKNYFLKLKKFEKKVVVLNGLDKIEEFLEID
jgi:deoxyadenosine/deoxycytidine kinase